MEMKYWKVIVRYGHVGKGNEISIARHLVVPREVSLVEVMDLVSQMPGTKVNPVVSAREISLEEYLEGHRREKEDFYLKNLFQNKRVG